MAKKKAKKKKTTKRGAVVKASKAAVKVLKRAKKAASKKATGKTVKPKLKTAKPVKSKLTLPNLEGFTIAKGIEVLATDSIGLVGFHDDLPLAEAQIFHSRDFAKAFLNIELARPVPEGGTSPFAGAAVASIKSLYAHSYTIIGGDPKEPYQVVVTARPKGTAVLFTKAFGEEKTRLAKALKDRRQICKIADDQFRAAVSDFNQITAKLTKLTALKDAR